MYRSVYCSVLQCVLQYVAHPIQGLGKGVHWQQAVAAPDTFALQQVRDNACGHYLLLLVGILVGMRQTLALSRHSLASDGRVTRQSLV